MHDAEATSLKRAAVLLLVLSLARWGLAHRPTVITNGDQDVLAAHAVATRGAVSSEERANRPLQGNERIDPNRADAVELSRLPGIGPSTAGAIVEARDTGTVFRRPGDLALVRGIGSGTVTRLAPWLDLDDVPVVRRTRGARARGSATPTPFVDVNRADESTLVELPGIGPVLAQRIVFERRRGLFSTLSDLTRVSGIGPAMVERLQGLATTGASR
jgi:DNA uptake protein ComE-like DNA-binding protein